MIKNKKQMIISISAFILVLMLTTVTFAFFNYTRTGIANVIRTGKISFNANQTETINLTNVFPIDKTTIGTDTVNTDETVITITGDTTYTEGIEYLVTAVDVNNTIGSGNNQKTVPISVSVTASNGLGTDDEEYFDNRENANSHLYRVLAKDVLEENGRIAVGYIKAGATGINGTLTIKAYLDKDKVAITDTYDGEESDNMGTTTEWVDNRTTLTTAEWNTLQTNGVSFKVKVESNEGIWVEEILSVNAMNTFPSAITDEKDNIKEVYFNKMGATRMQNAYDAATIKADLTYNNEGRVLAWLEENSDDNTKYNLIVASDGETYLTNGEGLFFNWSNTVKIRFNNINTTRIIRTWGMFANCSSLTELDLNNFKTSNLKGVNGMFNNCSSLREIDLSGFDTSQITDGMSMFTGCTSLEVIDLSSFNPSHIGASALFNVFTDLPSLQKIYVSPDLWDVGNQYDNMIIFNNCPNLVGGNGTVYDESNSNNKAYAIIDGTNGQPGYLTDIADKPTN